MKKQIFIHAIAFIFLIHESIAQGRPPLSKDVPKVLYGTASFYSSKFEGRQTANGEIFSQQKMTAACNVLPLGTWVRVTNLKNGRSVVVKINDRLHYKMKRVVDLSKVAARQIGHKDGLTRVKVEVVERKKAT
jgi:peptidoglycan lytic transglycosylase